MFFSYLLDSVNFVRQIRKLSFKLGSLYKSRAAFKMVHHLVSFGGRKFAPTYGLCHLLRGPANVLGCPDGR